MRYFLMASDQIECRTCFGANLVTQPSTQPPPFYITYSPTMAKRVEHDLLSLLPSITLPVPLELINLSVSLLAQSHSKASTLKKDEEIARGYVCAHIACERLLTRN